MIDDLAPIIRRFDWQRFLADHCRDVGWSGDQLVCFCPFCSHDRTSFALSPVKGLWICYHCNARGNAISLLVRLLSLSRSQAESRLRNGSSSYDPIQQETEQKSAIDIELPDEYEPLALPETKGNARFWRYIDKRGLPRDIAIEYEIGMCRSGLYGGRVVIPVTWKGELVSFIARDITNTHPKKVLTPRGGKQSRHLYNLENLADERELIVVEGALDALALPDLAIASFGKRLTGAQTALLVGCAVKRLYLCWDADAHTEATEAAERLAPFFDVRVALLGKGDPSDQGREAVLAAVEAAKEPSFIQRIEHRNLKRQRGGFQ